MTIEQLATDIRARHNLTTLHLFTSDIESLTWRVFAHRKDPRGFEASIESGGGETITDALNSLDRRLSAGPIAKEHIPILDAPKQQKFPPT